MASAEFVEKVKDDGCNEVAKCEMSLQLSGH